MPIKKSAVLLIAITAASFTLLALSSAKTLPATAQCMQMKNCNQLIETPAFSSWEFISQIVFRPTA